MKKNFLILIGIFICFIIVASGCGQSSNEDVESDDTDNNDESEILSESDSEDTNSEGNNNNSDDNNSGDESDTAENNSTSEDTGDTNQSEQVSEESESNSSAEVSNNASEKSNTTASEKNSTVTVSNIDEAINYLKNELDQANEVNINDTEFIQDESEDNEDFYTITLVSKELQKNGGSGTIGKYKVYADGEYELVY